MRVIFFGTPEFAVSSLEAAAREHEVVLVVAQPDRPAGRGMKMQPPAVAVRARELGLPLVQPAKIRDDAFLSSLEELHPDLGIVVAYGKILPRRLLDIPRYGFVNVHASLLPKWRGAAPIQRSIEAGDRETGVTIMRLDEELDHGAMLRVERTEIGPDERTPSLFARLARQGADALAIAMREIAAGTAVDVEQDHSAATYAAKIEKREGEVRFDEPATTIYNRFRAFDPWPGLFLQVVGETVKLTDLRPVADHHHGKPGEVLEIGETGVVVAAGEGAIRILEMQRPGKSRMRAAEVARALGWKVGEKIAG